MFKLDDGVVEDIIERTNCKPYLIQKICAAAVDRLHDEGRRRIMLADVEAVSHETEA